MSVNAAAPFGLLETLRWVDGGAPLLELHQRRLAGSWPAFFRGVAPELIEVAAPAIAQIARSATLRKGALLRVRFLGAAGEEASVDVDARALDAAPWRVSVALAPRPRQEPPEQRRHKSADRAWAEALAVAGAFETLVWDEELGLLEGTRTNLFVVKERELLTPPVEQGLVPGVVRARLIECAPRFGFTTCERAVAPEDLKSAAGLLLTGSGVGVVAVAECDGRPVTRDDALDRSVRELAARLAGAVLQPG